MKKDNVSYTYETLALKSDEELRKIFINVRSEIYKSRRKKKNTRQLEVEYCYIQKEIQDRRYTRKNKARAK